MSKDRPDLDECVPQEAKPTGQYRKPYAWVLSLALAGTIGAGAALGAAAMRDSYTPKPPGPGCGWGNLQGDLQGPPKLVLAFDEDLNVQGFFGPGGGVGSKPTTSPIEQLSVGIDKYNPKYCYKVGGVEHCVNY